MKIRPAGAELFYADGQTDGHDEANSRFSQFCERVYKKRISRNSISRLLFVMGKSCIYCETATEYSDFQKFLINFVLKRVKSKEIPSFKAVMSTYNNLLQKCM
jgi:hypothetical protein